MKHITVGFFISAFLILTACSSTPNSQTTETGDGFPPNIESESAEALVDEGREAYAAKDYDYALQLYNQAIHDYPDCICGFIARGNLLLDAFNDPTSAIRDYTQAIEINPESDIAYANRGYVYFLIEDYQSALDDLNHAIHLDPYYAKAYYKRGMVYASTQQLDLAMEDYNTSIQIEPSSQAHLNRGIAYSIRYQYDLAEEDFRIAILYNRHNVNAHVELAYIYSWIREDHETALTLLESALEINPDAASLYYARSRVYASLNELDLALEDLDHAIVLDLQMYDAYVLRGLIHNARGEYDLAAADFSSASYLATDDMSAMMQLARTYHKAKDYTGATLVYTYIIKLFPEAREIYILRGIVYQDSGQHDRANSSFETAMEMFDEEQYFLGTRAIFYMQFDEIEKYRLAFADLNIAIEINPMFEVYYIDRGDVYLALGEVELAVADYNTAIEISQYPTLRMRATDKLAALGLEPNIPPTQIPTREVYNIEYFSVGYSVNGNPLRAARVGMGKRILVLVGNLDSEDLSSYTLLFDLTQHYTITLPPEEFTLIIIPTANPDGYFAEERLNDNGVHLSRNWDTSNWQADIQGSSGTIIGGGGTAPFSEPETAALSAWLLGLQASSPYPVTVVFYRATDPPRGSVLAGYTLDGKNFIPDQASMSYGQTYADSVNVELLTVLEVGPVSGGVLLWCGENGLICFKVELTTFNDVSRDVFQAHIAALDELMAMLEVR